MPHRKAATRRKPAEHDPSLAEQLQMSLRFRARQANKRTDTDAIVPMDGHLADERALGIKYHVFRYGDEHVEETEPHTLNDCLIDTQPGLITWLDVDALHNADVVQGIGKHYGLHPLLIEDILHTDQRPKFDAYEGYIAVVTRMYYLDATQDHIRSEQVTFVLGTNYLLSFQEEEGDVFEPIRDRLRKNVVGIRSQGPDYLFYLLLDAITDSYFVVLDQISTRIETLEEELYTSPTDDTLHRIHALKREMILLRRAVWPLREVVGRLNRTVTELITPRTEVYLRDVYDHTIQVIDMIENFRDMVAGLQEAYLSTMSHKMNNVMRILTVFSTIFMPLTFIVGVYGMNFKYMPEIDMPWAYPAVWGLMILIVLMMLIYFQLKRWL